uniref:Putative RxLR effector n=1 Tax=Plasmopara viticola TaxID=143451 RepID=A0A650F4S0_PLAVT|nr:putative RxLR effector [Plasmopara viticola]
MRGAYYVAIALLVAVSCQTAAESDQAEPHQALTNHFMTSGGTGNKMLPRRILRDSHDLKDKLTVYASDEERMLNRLSSGASIAKGAEQMIKETATVLRADGENVIANAAKPIKNFNRMKPMVETQSTKRQRIIPTLNKVGGDEHHTSPKSGFPLPSFASANRRGKDELRVNVISAGSSVKGKQHEYRYTPSGSSPTSAAAADGRPNKQLKAIDLDKNKRLDEGKIKNKKRQRIDSMPDDEGGEALHASPNLEKSLLASASAKRLKKDEPRVNVNTVVGSVKTSQHDSRSAPSGSTPTSTAAADGRLNKQLIGRKAKNNDKNKRSDEVKPGNKKRQRIEPMPDDVGPHELHTTPKSKKYMVSVTKNAPVVLAKRLEPNEPTFIINNAVGYLRKHFLSAPSDSFPTSAAAPDGRLSEQLIARKHFEINLDKLPDEVEVRNSQRQSVDSMPYNLVGQALHAPPNFEKDAVSVANNAPFASANRLRIDEPTVSSNKAVRPTTHGDRPAPPSSSSTNAAAPNGRLDKQLPSQKAFKFDLNKHPDEMEFDSVERPLHLREENEKFALPAVKSQSIPINWRSEFKSGPYVRKKDRLTLKARKVHEAFIQAYNLPFHQYPAETAKMLRLVKWIKHHASPNNHHIFESLRDLASSQKLKRLKTLLRSDLENLLGNKVTELENDEKILKDAYTVKLVIMYELFYDFCHGNRNLIDNLPKESTRRDSILKVST